MIEIPNRAEGCDAPDPAPIYMGPGQTWICRCMVCARCGHHTGNSNQGHFWGYCEVPKAFGNFHFCCPNDCELEEKQ